MKRAFVLFVVAMLYCNPLLAQEPDPDPNLLWVTENSYQRFLVHPNGNIFAGKGSTEVEIDGNTGTIIREFPYQVIFYDISPDGKYISALTDQRCVIDYETQEVVVRFTTSNTSPKFMPDNKTLIFNLEVPFSESYQLASFNIETKQQKISQNYFEKTQIGSPCVSPDGRFVATVGWFYKTQDEGDTHLLLWDAQTLAPIKILSENKGFREVRSIKFSPDSRLVGFGVYFDNLYLYDTDKLSLYKHYGKNNILNGVMGFGFITNDLIAVGSDWNQVLNFEIINMKDDKSIYKRNDFTGLAEYNIAHNTLIILRHNIFCFDFEKIMTGASIEPEIQNPFTVEYLNNALSIRNFTFANNQISCSITDINGRVIRTMNLNLSTGDIRIPLKLISGTYFLHIKDGSKEYVNKFLVVN
ncbi:MAG: T9SS type A sorting domain-containing protein [Desulfobulbaceae bacterium]|nr:T9SS type A sorting domain-containing protein [Candidatus Kapabacteria bacterium]MBS4000303.1 T9SS type A sorting domain-containing protein [Desulfobulbaceae bacterium]